MKQKLIQPQKTILDSLSFRKAKKKNRKQKDIYSIWSGIAFGLQSREKKEERLFNLKNEVMLVIKNKEESSLMSVKEYVFSKQAFWYWATLAFAMATVIAVFGIAESAVPLVYVRSLLGFIFILFLPGFAFTKALFPIKVPIKTSSENIDIIERGALSLGMSIVFVPIVGLILNYTPWGIRLTPIILSLLAITIFFATAALLREYQAKAQAVKINPFCLI